MGENVTSRHSLVQELLLGFRDGGDEKSLLDGFLHRNNGTAALLDQAPRVLENTLLAVAAAGAVLLLLLFPLVEWIRTGSFHAVIRFLSIPSLWTGLANSAIWMLYTSFVMKKDDCLELIIVYPMLLTINFVYLMIIYVHKRSYIKALFIASVVFASLGYMFYIIRFEPKPPIKADYIASIGLVILLIFNTFLLKDLVDLNGRWERFAAFCNIGLTTLLNLMTFYVLIKKYPVQYFPILSSFMGVIWGSTELLFLILRICFRRHNDENEEESSDDEDEDDEDESHDEDTGDDDESDDDSEDDQSEDDNDDEGDDDHNSENENADDENGGGGGGDEVKDDLDANGGGDGNQTAAVLPYVRIDIPDEYLTDSEAEPALGCVPIEEELKKSAEPLSNQNLPPHQEIGMPSLSPTMTEGNISKWMKKEGDKVSPGEVLCEVETDKATVELQCMEDGYVAKIVHGDRTKQIKVGEMISVTVEEEGDIEKFKDYIPSSSDAVVAPSESKANYEPVARTPQPKAPNTQEASSSWNKIFSSPLARKLAEDHNVLLSSVKGTSPDVPVKADNEDYIEDEVNEVLHSAVAQNSGISSVINAAEEEITEVEQAVNRQMKGGTASGKKSVSLGVLLAEEGRLSSKEKRTKKQVVRGRRLPWQVKPVRKKPWLWRPGICCEVDA